MRRRYRQVRRADGSYAYIEIGSESDVENRLDIHVQASFEPFRSVVDGSVVTNRRDLALHNQRNNVVHESEFGTDKERAAFHARKAAERADLYQGTAHTLYGKRLKRERIADIVDAINQSEAKELKNG